jgi:hypothetical protein
MPASWYVVASLLSLAVVVLTTGPLLRTLPYVKFLDDLYLYMAYAFPWNPHGPSK